MQRLKLLIIDNDLDYADNTGAIACKAGFEVRVADTVADFMAIYRRFEPDLIVMEIVLDDMNGLELIKWLQDQGCEAHVLILTGFNPNLAMMADMLIRHRGHMTAEIVHKPIDDRTLARTLELLRLSVVYSLPRSADVDTPVSIGRSF